MSKRRSERLATANPKNYLEDYQLSDDEYDEFVPWSTDEQESTSESMVRVGRKRKRSRLPGKIYDYMSGYNYKRKGLELSYESTASEESKSSDESASQSVSSHSEDDIRLRHVKAGFENDIKDQLIEYVKEDCDLEQLLDIHRDNPGISAYECRRKLNIIKNDKLLKGLGIKEVSNSLKPFKPSYKKQKPKVVATPEELLNCRKSGRSRKLAPKMFDEYAQRPFSCDYCYWRGNRAKQLKRHMQSARFKGKSSHGF